MKKPPGPRTRLTFLAFDIDTMGMFVRIPEAKFNALVDLVKNFFSQRKGHIAKIAILVGLLFFSARQ